MGKNYGPWVDYKCFDDCQQGGCPGHKVREVGTYTIGFEFEDGHFEHFDEGRWEAMKAAHQLRLNDRQTMFREPAG